MNGHSAGRPIGSNPRCRATRSLGRLLSSASIAAVVLAGCSDGAEPLPPDVWLATSASYVDVFVDDSVLVHAQVRDGFDQPLPIDAAVQQADPTIVSVIADANQLPAALPEERFWIKALAFGLTKVEVSHSDLAAEITVRTWPGGIVTRGTPDTIQSGSSFTVSAVGTGTAGTELDGVPIEWASSDTSVATILPDDVVRARAPGSSALSATTFNDFTATDTVHVVAVPFAGNLSRSSAGFLDTLTIVPSATLPWTGGERFSIGGLPAWVVHRSHSTATVLVPNGPLGTNEVLVLDQGPERIAGAANIDITSRYQPHATPDSALIVDVAALPGTWYVSLTEDLQDDYYRFEPATTVTVDVTLSWQTDADLDFWWFSCDRAVTYDTQGATLANPERGAITIPAGDCRLLWLDWYSGPGSIAILTLGAR